MGGKIFTPLGAWYHATKHALEGWSDCLRIETAPFGIQVVVVEPGGIKTEFGDVVGQQLQKYYGHSAYDDQMKPFVDMMGDESSTMDRMTEPEVLGRVFLEAATTRKPKRGATSRASAPARRSSSASGSATAPTSSSSAAWPAERLPDPPHRPSKEHTMPRRKLALDDATRSKDLTGGPTS